MLFSERRGLRQWPKRSDDHAHKHSTMVVHSVQPSDLEFGTREAGRPFFMTAFVSLEAGSSLGPSILEQSSQHPMCSRNQSCSGHRHTRRHTEQRKMVGRFRSRRLPTLWFSIALFNSAACLASKWAPFMTPPNANQLQRSLLAVSFRFPTFALRGEAYLVEIGVKLPI